MKKYIDISLLPSPDIPAHFLWEKLYQQVHLALVEVQDNNGEVDIGLAFPQYDAAQFQIGCKLRLFAENETELKKLNIVKWLSRLTDYAHISSIRDVPSQITGYACFKRVQTKSSKERLARRKAKREGISVEKALSLMKKSEEKISNVPYIHMKSLSSENRYRLMIDCVNAKDNCVGKFSTYGLSAKSTVPVF